jgi:hypothetical protein
VTSIKPPGGPGGVGGPKGPEATKDTAPTSGPSFQERVAGNRGAQRATAADPSQAVIADLRAGKITPNEAVHRLTDIAVTRSHAPPGVRPAVEARMRELLTSDPLVQDILRQMGATLDTDK